MKRAEVRWRLDKAQTDAAGGDAAKNPAKVAAADAAAIAARAKQAKRAKVGTARWIYKIKFPASKSVDSMIS